jgi:hypothetical protein
MAYTTEQSETLVHECEDVLASLQDLMLGCVTQGQDVPNSRAREHMLHGAGRRVSVLRRSVENIFNLFPPSLERPLTREALADVQINLQAFVFNLYGVFENWAWAFVFRHGLDSQIGSRRNVGLFKDQTQRFLPQLLKDYLVSETMTTWHKDYLTGYRDALAHRIPLYIPPAEWTPEEAAQYEQLETEKLKCMRGMQWEQLDAVRVKQENIGRPCLTFLHAFSDEEAQKSVLIHPQLLCDSKAVVEFGTKYLEAWHLRTDPGEIKRERRR